MFPYRYNLSLHEETTTTTTEDELPTDLDAQIKDHPYVKSLREKAAAARVKLKEKEDAEKEAAKAQLKEQNKYKELYENSQKELDKIKAEYDGKLSTRDARVIASEIKSVASDLGVKKEAMGKLMNLLDTEGIEIDDDGDVVGAKEAVEKLKEEMPFLFEEESGSGGGGGVTTTVRRPARGGTTTTTTTDFKDKSKTRADLNAAWDNLAKR